MTELEQIREIWREASARGESGVLASVVRIHGSAYRRPGARLLLTSGGRRSGAVSGGCLEADLVKKAWWLTEGGKTALRRYDTTNEGEITQEFGLGCNGVIYVLLERLEQSAIPILDAVEEVRVSRLPAALAAVIGGSDQSPVRLGDRWLRRANGETATNIASHQLVSLIEREADLALEQHSTRIVSWEAAREALDVFVEPIFPSLRLLIFGAGEDAVPMAKLAKFLGYEVIVLDGRSHFAHAGRFAADRVIVNSESDPLAGIVPDQWTAAVLMSHSYAQDLAALCVLASHRLPYLGLLGPRKRTESLLSDAGLEPEQVLPPLHSPMGLDTGADGAEQIALSVIAEIQAVVNQRAGGRLREKAGPLHPRSIGDAERELFNRSVTCPLTD
ncbi:MAG TPA: XdhC family protein [Bryobacteraceae bacterium]|nr:XdhC family protein [Bryobacteraceae bacterium]